MWRASRVLPRAHAWQGGNCRKVLMAAAAALCVWGLESDASQRTASSGWVQHCPQGGTHWQYPWWEVLRELGAGGIQC